VIPLRDDQPRTTIPYVNYSIIALNLAVFGFEIWSRFNNPPALRSFFARYTRFLIIFNWRSAAHLSSRLAQFS
jgi:hypothetical protein